MQKSKILSFAVVGILVLVSIGLHGCGDPDLSREEAHAVLKKNHPNITKTAVAEFKESFWIYSPIPATNIHQSVFDYVTGNEEKRQAAKVMLSVRSSSVSQKDIDESFHTMDQIRPPFSAQLAEGLGGKASGIGPIEINVGQSELCLSSVSTPGRCHYDAFDCSIGEITGVSGQGIERQVEYVMDCEPNERATYMGQTKKQESAITKFRLYDDGWREISNSASIETTQNERNDESTKLISSASTPDAQQIKIDLIGQKMYVSKGIPSYWEFSSLSTIQEVIVNSHRQEGELLEYDVTLMLETEHHRTHKLVLYRVESGIMYKKVDGSWQILSVSGESIKQQ